MINGINQRKVSANIDQSVKNAKTDSPAQTAKTTAPPPSSGARSAVSLAAAAGLPSDKLSASIVSFARFFSLPLKPQLLADIRRQALPAQSAAKLPAQSAANASVPAEQSAVLTSVKSLNNARTREAMALSAAAAESKGVELTQKGLESYTEAVDPDSRRQDGERRQKDNKRNDQSEKDSSQDAEINPDAIKKTALECEKNLPLLEILNKLPGKNNQRWIVLPFDFSQDGREYFVSMRILLDEEKTARRVVCMAMDVLMRNVELGMTNEERQLFILEFANDKIIQLIVYYKNIISDISEREEKTLKSEISKHFNILLDKIKIKYYKEAFPFEADLNEDIPVIDEAV